MLLPEPDRRLIHRLKAMQIEEGYAGCDAEWARHLGITQGHWSKLKNEHRGIGKRFSARLAERYPQLWRMVQDVFMPANMQDAV